MAIESHFVTALPTPSLRTHLMSRNMFKSLNNSLYRWRLNNCDELVYILQQGVERGLGDDEPIENMRASLGNA